MDTTFFKKGFSRWEGQWGETQGHSYAQYQAITGENRACIGQVGRNISGDESQWPDTMRINPSGLESDGSVWITG